MPVPEGPPINPGDDAHEPGDFPKWRFFTRCYNSRRVSSELQTNSARFVKHLSLIRALDGRGGV